MQPEKSVIVVGAGIAGLMAARTLKSANIPVTVLDKGRGVGGRMATRRTEDAVCDHGAQFFTVRTERFGTIVHELLANGAATEWCRGFASARAGDPLDGHPRYRGVRGMSDIAKYLAKDIDVVLNARVIDICRLGERWKLTTEIGETFTCEELVMTCPAQQALALLETGAVALAGPDRKVLEAIDYDPCLALIVTTEGGSSIPFPGAIQNPAADIDFIADNCMKGISPNRKCFTIHASGDFSREHYASDNAAISQWLLERVSPWITGDIRQIQVHRWKYAKPIRTYSECFYRAISIKSLMFAGDGFGEGRVEGAALSGMAVGEEIAANWLPQADS